MSNLAESAVVEKCVKQQQQQRHQSSASSTEERKLQNFISKFEASFNSRPSCVIRAPGRVNLIGDHVDYHGFPVLPMAIENSIWLGCRFEPANIEGGGDGGDDTGARLELANSDTSNFPHWTGRLSMTDAANLDKSHQWQNYILCGYHGVVATDLHRIQAANVLEHAKRLQGDPELLAACASSMAGVANCKLLVDSDLPPASGLSSSSALVCASALATALLLRHSKKVNSDRIDSIEMANNCSKYEHLIGTHGGGMDQAVIMTAQEGFAKYVEFRPKFRCENVRLPRDTVWLVSHCGFSYAKASTSGFNSRVLETKIGAAFIAKAKRASNFKLDWTITLAKIKSELYDGISLTEMFEDLRHNVFEDRSEFTVDEVCDKLELTREQLQKSFNTSDRLFNEVLNSKLQLLNRCEHVFEEADRVERFKSICDTTVDIAQLGQLMTQSHYSLRDKFECSHPALDKLVSVALDAGALGSRLTGAGWGGCIVSLVEASKRDTVTERLKEVSKFTFQTEPQSGCEVFWVGDM